MKTTFTLTAAVLALSTPVQADESYWQGLSIGFGYETAEGATAFPTAELVYMLPVGSNLLVGPVVGWSDFSQTQTTTSLLRFDPRAARRISPLDYVSVGTELEVEQDFSLGVRAGVPVSSDRGFLFGELGAEQFDVTLTENFFSFNRPGQTVTNDTVIGAYASVGYSYRVLAEGNLNITGQITHSDQVGNSFGFSLDYKF